MNLLARRRVERALEHEIAAQMPQFLSVLIEQTLCARRATKGAELLLIDLGYQTVHKDRGVEPRVMGVVLQRPLRKIIDIVDFVPEIAHVSQQHRFLIDFEPVLDAHANLVWCVAFL